MIKTYSYLDSEYKYNISIYKNRSQCFKPHSDFRLVAQGTGTTNPGQSEPRSNGSEGLLHIP